MAHFEITRTVRRKVQILGSYGARARVDMPLLLELVARGRLNLEGLVSARFPLEEASRAYDLLDRGLVVGRAVVELT
jgi:succinate semialdehyde reductase (NADPH)